MNELRLTACLLLLAAILWVTPLAPAGAAGTAEVVDPPTPATTGSMLKARLKERYPNTRFDSVHPSALPGLWEVRMGTNVAYTMGDGRYFLFGHLYDMELQRDLTAARAPGHPAAEDRASDPATPAAAIAYADLPWRDAIKRTRGLGRRHLAVFSDPACRYCQTLERELAQLDDVTVHTFLLPSPGNAAATQSASAIWCGRDRAAAWEAVMLRGVVPPARSCAHPLARNLELARRSGIAGTPFLLFPNGLQLIGAQDSATLERALNGERQP